MARTTVTVPPEVRDILKRCPITVMDGAWHLEITVQLDRKLYEAVNKVLLLAGGKWNRGAKAHIFTEDPTTVLLGAVETGAVVDEKKLFQSYYTPPELARQLVDAAGIEVGMSVLEPSCGHGAIASLIAEDLGYWPDCVELDPKAVAHMVKTHKVTRVWGEDFIGWAARTENRYDRIVMNPPFTGGQDIAHVAAAITLLKPGGVLVAIMSPHWTFAEDKDSTQLRAFLGMAKSPDLTHGVANSERALWTKNPDNAFASSGTNVNTGILRYHAPVRRPKPLPSKAHARA